jgi:nitronate monooxygenase
LDIPILAAGGMATGRSMAAALALGAQGVTMGTRFMLTREAPVHEAIKQALIEGSERDTTLIFRALRNTARVFRNAVSEEVNVLEREPGAKFEDIKALVAGVRGRAALETGEIDGGLIWAGLGVGLIDDIPSCAELVERIVEECREAAQRLGDLVREVA